MAFAFDTLGYAKKLRNAGVPQDQAEAHAEAAREFVMAELVTRHDLAAVTASRKERDAMGAIRSRLTAKGQTTIPRAVREALNLKEGDVLEFEVEKGAARIRKAAPEDPEADREAVARQLRASLP